MGTQDLAWFGLVLFCFIIESLRTSLQWGFCLDVCNQSVVKPEHAELGILFLLLIPFLLFKAGIKASATVQPFLLLHLNICPEPVCTIEDALHLFSAPETLEGYRTSAPGKVWCFVSYCTIFDPLKRCLNLHVYFLHISWWRIDMLHRNNFIQKHLKFLHFKE